MSMTMCSACEQIQDSDFVQFDEILGEQVCESCWPDEEESIVPQPRTALFRLAAALSIAEFTKADPDTRSARDTRPADTMAAECYWPSECPVCERPSMQGSLYCGPECEGIMTGTPDAREIAANL